ncbi:MAG: type II/IV secretion system protein [Candidatus Harrisonbacteria bacterium]|nr:type II/IV secretion system protein [Candidatus Harrisonbacteria bacterium]MBI2406173.1 type II/IV secretion system protein [Candidatus Harrisonbacteria bacterium]MBI2604304.1 type II/IV secretion system protein [Candidatus Harrisonbacteria bacterium]MBI3114624.1 type II/IV secretion system protein [Candidatus Harrisonbacteria bacterium]
MKIDNKKLKELLVKESYIAEEVVEEALARAERTATPLTTVLIERGILTNDLLGQAIAEYYGVPYADMNSNPPTAEQVNLLPEEFARRNRAVVYEKEEGKPVIVAATEPDDPKLLEELTRILKTDGVKLIYALPDEVEAAFVHYRKPLETRFRQIAARGGRLAAELFDYILADAALLKASDVHIEPHEQETLVRFRVDGVLHDAGRIPREYHENIVNRIKVLSRLRTDEHKAVQDGAVRVATDGKVIEARVSIAPIYDGEKVVMRILAYYVRGFTLHDLGFFEEHRRTVEEAAKSPFGMILAAGPTGSGKTTTLYAVTKLLNSPGINITTIEDPVEYKIEGVNHIQVNPAVGLTFAQGLKSIVRQDPDIILVGEIRDSETASIAVNAALTGHLLLSTLHANDAATAIPRLLEMGVEPFLIASTVEIIVAQRLVRKICESCRMSYVVTKQELGRLVPGAQAYFGNTATHTLFKGRGCAVCQQSGYSGRTGIFEILPASTELRELILKKPSISEIYALEGRQKVRSLFDDGIEKVKAGITTIEEVKRVAEPRGRALGARFA